MEKRRVEERSEEGGRVKIREAGIEKGPREGERKERAKIKGPGREKGQREGVRKKG